MFGVAASVHVGVEYPCIDEISIAYLSRYIKNYDMYDLDDPLLTFLYYSLQFDDYCNINHQPR